MHFLFCLQQIETEMLIDFALLDLGPFILQNIMDLVLPVYNYESVILGL